MTNKQRKQQTKKLALVHLDPFFYMKKKDRNKKNNGYKPRAFTIFKDANLSCFNKKRRKSLSQTNTPKTGSLSRGDKLWFLQQQTNKCHHKQTKEVTRKGDANSVCFNNKQTNKHR